MDNITIDIAFSFDSNYYKVAYVAISSLLQYAKDHPRNNLNIFYNKYFQ